MASCVKCKGKDLNVEKLKKCNHNICYECLCVHLAELTSAKVTCPIEGCKTIIQDHLVRKCLSNAKLLFYDQLCLAPNTVKCLIKDCPYFVAYEEKTGNFTCPICNQPNCLSCGQLHREGEECQSRTDINGNEFENAAYQSLLGQRKEALYKDSDMHDLIPNAERFECPICMSFILPRNGISLRNCLDTFCKPCLEAHVETIDNLKNMSCPLNECNRPFTERECQKFVGKEKLQNLCLDIVKAKMFNCQSAECKGMWDFASYTGKHKCPICHKVNCAICQDIHDGQTCQEFQQTQRFKDANKFRANLKERTKIICQNCGVIIIKNQGCNALRCPTCRLQVCAYSGKEIGPKGCKCTNSKRCVEGCHPGCIPEGESRYEKELAKYFWEN